MCIYGIDLEVWLNWQNPSEEIPVWLIKWLKGGGESLNQRRKGRVGSLLCC